MKNKFKKLGQTAIIVSIIGGCCTLVASVGVSYFASKTNSNNTLIEARQNLAVLKATENLHYEEVQKQISDFKADTKQDLSELNRKMDILINKP